MENQNPESNSKFKKWLKRFGWAGLLFFTIKGFVWLAVIYFGADLLEGCAK